MSDVKPELDKLACELERLTWGDVVAMAVQLKMEFTTLQQIRQDNPDQRSRVLAAMTEWLNNDEEASWKKVASALRAIKKNVLANELEKKYCSSVSTDSPAKATPQTPPQAPPQTPPQTLPQATPQAKTQEDKTLGPDDALKVLEEILEAQNVSRFLGLKWNIPEYIISGIHSHYTMPKDRLYYVIVEFLKQLDPTPTWRVIADALKSPAVNLPRLAQKIERDHNLVVTASPSRPAPPPSNPSGALSDKPTLPRLLHFKTSSGQSIRIAEQIGANYLTFGTLLLEDDTGAITNAITTRHQNNAVAINQDILTRWLQGQGKKPVNWSSLLEILEDVGLPELAQTVRDNL